MNDAIEEVARLLAEFKRHADDMNVHTPQLQMRYSSSGKKFCEVLMMGRGLVFAGTIAMATRWSSRD
jgi:hypothetical protein